MEFIKQLIYWIKCKPSGLNLRQLKKEAKKSKYQLGWWWGTYQPSIRKTDNKRTRILDQGRSYCCQWFATIASKEVDEKVDLSVEAFVSKAKKLGLTGFKGASSLKSGQFLLKEWGAVKDSLIEDRNPNDYNYFSSVNTDQYDDEASKHKSKTWWYVRSRDEILKLLEEGHSLVCGINWRTLYNRSSGRDDYYYIRDNAGYSVGGHAIKIDNFDLDYNGRETLLYQNSYGKNWGVNGGGYIDIEWFLKNNHGCLVSLDIPRNEEYTAENIKKMSGENFKGNKKPGIYRISDGYKQPYRNAEAFLSHNGIPYTYKNAFTVVNQEELDKVPDSYGTISVKGGKYEEMVKILKDPVNNNFNKEK